MPVWLEIALGVSALLAAIGSLFAAFYANRISIRAFEWQQQQAGPYVQVSARMAEDCVPYVMLYIENVGESPAYDIRFELSQEIPDKAISGVVTRSAGGKKELPRMERGPLITGIPALAARDNRQQLWGDHSELYADIGDAIIHVRASYKDSDRREYKSLSILEINSLQHNDFMIKDPLKRTSDALESISEWVRKCAGY